MTKHEKLTNYFVKAYKKKVAEKDLKHFVFSTEKQVEKFISDRLCLHGRNGYKFHASMFYKRYELDVKKDIETIVKYIVECNTFRKRMSL